MSKKSLPLEATSSSTPATESHTENASHTPIFEGNIVVAGGTTFSTPVCTFPSFSWSPKEDITSYELALCLPKLMSVTTSYRGFPLFSKEELDGIKEGVGPFRHFQLA